MKTLHDKLASQNMFTMLWSIGADNCICQASVLQRRAILPQKLFIVTGFLATACTARLEDRSSGDGANRRAGADFAIVLHYMTYMMIIISTGNLVVSLMALLQMPKPRCLCYNVPYSDAAVCYGTPCCSCVNMRQLSATLVLLWSMLLLIELAMGLDMWFLYPYLGFCTLHGLTFIVVQLRVRVYRNQAVMMAGAADNHAATRLAMAADAAAVNGRLTTAEAPPPIQTMSAELVLVLQPDYGYYGNSGIAAAEAGEDGELRRSNSSAAGMGSSRRSGALACSYMDSPSVKLNGCPAQGIAWALRYTRVETVPSASPPKLAPALYSGYGATDGPGAGASPPPLVSAEGGRRGDLGRALSTGSRGGGGGGTVGANWLPDADSSIRSAFAAAATLWRTGSGVPCTIQSAQGAQSLAAPSPPLPPPVGGCGGGVSGSRQVSCIRSTSVGLPLRQIPAGAAMQLEACSVPSYAFRNNILSKRSSPGQQPPAHFLPLSPSPRYQQQTQHQTQHQPQHQPPARPASSSSSPLYGGSPPGSRLDMRIEVPLTGPVDTGTTSRCLPGSGADTSPDSSRSLALRAVESCSSTMPVTYE